MLQGLEQLEVFDADQGRDGFAVPLQFDALALVRDTVERFGNIAAKGGGGHLRHVCIMYVQYVKEQARTSRQGDGHYSRPGQTSGARGEIARHLAVWQESSLARRLNAPIIRHLSLTPGTRLGVYEITAPIGEGGMGQVFRARDTKLDRDVAIKILPDAFAHDADRLARFQREAKTLASLNHPHIAGIYGLEESGGMTALVMELVEGDDLSQRIARGAIPLDEALPIAKQIAEALEAAHEQRIIHRDLKPANIKVRADGTVKVLDFGLAKAMEPASVSASAMSSPTITTPAMTLQGVILGTAAYMAPEQAKGRAVDKRADIWAFGVVLYEMLTGRRLFDAEDMSETLAAVLTRDVSLTTLPAAIPARLRTLLRDCLIRDPRQRLRDIGDARIVLEQVIAGAPGDVSTPASVNAIVPAWRRALPWASTAALAAGLATVIVMWAPWRQPAAPPRVTRTTITASGAAALTITGIDRDLALSPDGTHVVYVGNGGTQLFVRALDALEPVAIVSGGDVRGPFVSPDGQWVGFFENVTTLRKVAITGGPPITLARLGAIPRGATWAPDDTIIFATSDPATGLQRVSAAGGTPEVLTRPDYAQGEANHLWPEILPGGRAVLFTIMSQTGGLETAQVAVHDLRTGIHKALLRGGSHGRYVASGLASPKLVEGGLASTKPGEVGHLVYVAAGTLRAMAFDPNRLETHGTSVPVLPRLATTSFGAGDFAVAADGTLVYVDAPGSLAANARTLVWVDRTGKEEPVAAPPRVYQHPRLSPDGTRVALTSNDQENDLWIWDLARDRRERRAARAHRRATLGRGAEAPRADEVTGAGEVPS